ncbi:BMC_2a_G0007560.mRNA.1.CDS.1 [Saccharomyces cerevisiae]|nr:Mhf2p [Saccharomyces cerevisiae YJM1447]CAI4313356.1 BMB_G0007520.mRNA.1.CDS.1 [Saccharomyces cerevisiae]CAI4313913.1 BMC_2a_G0007560.mRNA.1.CDS.1 [Saccharomyces cerevisiae]CAI7062142.1 BMC_2a_G0007560.mRNA.1.CDS.1 [Saccharomyces cerevisiae]CAI7063162.1 BMB_G0007520.mRNA.1.CDS.1 [Saccharomyces cerevisiae]
MLSKEALIKILSQNEGGNDMKIADEVVPMIQKYLDIFIDEAVLRSLQSHKDINGERGDKSPLELSHQDLERIAGLLLMDM